MQSTEGKPERASARKFAKTWDGFKGQPSTITPGKTLDPLADWQIAVAVRFAEAYAQSGDGTGALNEIDLARRFHTIYESLAPQFGYETRKESARPWSQVPEKNQNLMIAVCKEIIAEYKLAGADSPEHGKPPDVRDRLIENQRLEFVRLREVFGQIAEIASAELPRGAASSQGATSEPKECATESCPNPAMYCTQCAISWPGSAPEPPSHHVWCNFANGPVETCKQCPGLWEKYPYKSAEEMEGLTMKHFPDAVVRSGAGSVSGGEAGTPGTEARSIQSYDVRPFSPMTEAQAVHVEQWLNSNHKSAADVKWSLYPIGMVQRWVERAEAAEAGVGKQGGKENG